MSTSKANGKSMLLLSDLSNASNNSDLDDQSSVCESSNTAITSLDDASELSQPPVLNKQFKVPRSLQWGNNDMSSSNTCNGISSSSIIDEESSDLAQAGQVNEPSEHLIHVQKLLKAIIRGASKPCALDNMTLGDFKSGLGLGSEDSNSVSEGRSSAALPYLCSENAIDEATFISKYKEDFSLFKSYPSRYNSYELSITAQPEEQHRARYMTEGSRGAVKDKSGSGYPTLRLYGYSGDETILLQVYIGSDELAPYPHLYYQASKVCNKNSPPCNQKTIQGTTVIEMEVPAQKDMTFSIDCVGILKERNVDVDQRLSTFQECNVDTSKYPNETTSKARKKSPSCRLVFRVIIPVIPSAESDEPRTSVILQVVSELINCTQQTAGPEICRQSLTDCPCNGGAELFLIGKNFQKDSLVVFQNHGAPQISPSKSASPEDTLNSSSTSEENSALEKDGKKGVLKWMEIVTPEKDFLHTNHLICKIPPYKDAQNLQIPFKVQFYVSSGERNSTCHFLTFHPINSNVAFMFSGSNIESKLLDTTIKNHGVIPPVVAVQNPNMDRAASYNAKDLNVVTGAKVLRANANEPTQSSPVIVFLPSGNIQNGQSQILPLTVSTTSKPSLVTKQEPLIINQMAKSSSSPNDNTRSTENPVAMQTLQLMIQPQNCNNVGVSQSKPKETFGLKDYLSPVQSQATESSVLANLSHENTQEALFLDKKLKKENELLLLTHAHNHETVSSEPQAKYLKGMNSYDDVIPNPEISTGLTQQILSHQHFKLQQEQIKIQNELDQKVIEAQSFQQQQQMNQVLQSQAQQLAQDCQEIGRQIEIQLGQGLENNLQFQQQQHQIQQAIQIQQVHSMDQSLRTTHTDDQIQAKIHLEFEQKLSPSEKRQLENGLHQIQQEQLEKEKLRNDLHRLQQDPLLNGLQQHMTVDQSHIENRHMAQEPSESAHLHFQLKEAQLVLGSAKSSSVMTGVNKNVWPSSNPLFTNSISPSTKIDNFFFGKENPKPIESSSGTTFINSSLPINAEVMNFQSQMDTSFSVGNSCLNKPNIFNQSFPLHPVESPSNLETKLQSQLQNFLPVASLTPNTNSLGFHPNNVIRNSEIENMDVSVQNSLLKRVETQTLETANQMLNTSVFGGTQQMQGITTSTVVPMTLENSLPPTLPALCETETQFLRPDIFSTNLLTNGVTGIAQSKTGHTNLPILGNNIFPINILEPNQQAHINKCNETTMNGQREFLHSGILQQAPTPMVLGHSSNLVKDNKTTLMDVSMAPLDKMDTSFSLIQTANVGGLATTISPGQCKMSTSRDQMIKILNDTDMMYHLPK